MSSFSTTDGVIILYSALVQSELEYIPITWKSITLTDLSNLTEFKENFQPHAGAYFLLESVRINMKICIGKICQHFNQHKSIPMPYFLSFLKINFAAHPLPILFTNLG
jgi:hypothetical protein